jgi:hypothetical protein
MTWNPTKFNDKTVANINATIQNNLNGHSDGRMSHKFQASNGITNGVTNGLETMETAELIFPELDLISKATTGDQKGFKKKLGRGKAFVDDYMDRRAQAKFVSNTLTLINPLRLMGINFLTGCCEPWWPSNATGETNVQLQIRRSNT